MTSERTTSERTVNWTFALCFALIVAPLLIAAWLWL